MEKIKHLPRLLFPLADPAMYEMLTANQMRDLEALKWSWDVATADMLLQSLVPSFRLQV